MSNESNKNEQILKSKAAWARPNFQKNFQSPTTKFKHFWSTSKHFQAPLSVLMTFKGLKFVSVKFKQFKDFQGRGETL